MKVGTTIISVAVRRAALAGHFFMVVCFGKDTIKAGASQSDEYMNLGGARRWAVYDPGAGLICGGYFRGLFAGAQHAGDGFGLGVDVELVVDIADVRADGADADTVFVGDLFIAKPIDERVENFVLADGELIVRDGCTGSYGLKALDDLSGDAGGHGGAAMIEVADSLDDLGWRGLFEQVARGAGADGVEDIFIVVEDGEHQHLDRGKMCLDGTHAFDAGDVGEADVHEDDIGQGCADLADDIEEIIQRCHAAHAIR